MDLHESLKWCAHNGVSLSIVDTSGTLAVTAGLRNISATYAVEEPVGPESVGTAVLSAVLAVEHGTGIFLRYGHFPPITKSDRGAETVNGAGINE